MTGSFRKSVLAHRISLERVWPLAFPKHRFSDLRLVQSTPDRAESYWQSESWARAARAYHAERKGKKAAMTDREHVSVTWLEGKVADQLDELCGIVDALQDTVDDRVDALQGTLGDRMDRLEQRQEELIRAFNNNANVLGEINRAFNNNAGVLRELQDKWNTMVDQVQKAAAPQPAPDASKPAVKKPPAKPGFKPKIVPKNGPDKDPPAA